MAEFAPTLDTDLPLPQSDTGHLGAAVRTLHPVATRATEPMAALAPRSWWGGARRDAEAELAVMRSLAADAATRANGARLGLAAYVSALVHTRGTILGLREEWARGEHRRRLQVERLSRIERAQQACIPILAGAAAGLDVAAAERAAEAEWARLRADLRQRHGHVMRSLDAERARCIAVLRDCLTGIPGTTPASTRTAIIGRLPLAAAAERAAQTRRHVAALCAQLGDPRHWRQEQWEQLAAAGDAARDPVFAAELLTWLGPATLLRLGQQLRASSSRFAAPGDQQAASGALTTLALALTAAANPRSGGPDPDVGRQLASWRSGWLTGLVDELHRDHASVLALAALLRRAGAQGVSPGADFARRVAPAFVRFDARLLPPVAPGGSAPNPTAYDPRDEAILGLLAGVGEDAEAVRALLAARHQLGVAGSGTVLDYLVAYRTTRGRAIHPDVTSALAAALRVATEGSSRDAAACASAVLGAQVALWQALGGVHDQSAQLAAAMNATIAGLAADLLTAHPQALADALFDPPATGGDGRTPRPEELVAATRDGYRFVLPDRAAALALLALLARSSTTPTDVTSAAASDTPISRVLPAVWGVEARRLADALTSRDRDARTAALSRLGAITGYLMTASATGQHAAHAGADELARRQQQLFTGIIDRLQIPGPLRKNLPAWAADACLRLAKVKLHAIVEHAYPTDNAGRAQGQMRQTREQARDELRDVAWDLVSATSTALPDPRAWPMPPGGEPFWGADGRPLPLAQLHGQARQMMIQWAHDVPEYQVVTSSLWDDFELGRALSGNP